MPLELSGDRGVTYPTWTTAARPSSPSVGLAGYNTTNNVLEVYNGIDWYNSSGSLSWQSVQTTGFTAAAGRAYPCNTTSAAFTVTLPASPTAGNVITLVDYAGTWATNNLTINPNGNKLEGITLNQIISTNRGSVNLVYIDATQGWITYSNVVTDIINPPTFSIEYLVAGGGGGGGRDIGGGGGGGGYRTNYTSSAGVSTPKASGGGASIESALSIYLETAYSIVIGAGGAGATTTPATSISDGGSSTFATITSSGGGGGGSNGTAGRSGGSGGGASRSGGSIGTGTANQGYNGGTGTDSGGNSSGGGGGAGAVGGNASGTSGGSGGQGVYSDITGTSVQRAGGGGGCGASGGLSGNAGSGGAGGGGAGSNGSSAPVAALANTCSGGGGGGNISNLSGANGGSGVIVLRIPNTRTATFSAGVTSSLNTSVSGYKIYTITNTSTTSETVTFS